MAATMIITAKLNIINILPAPFKSSDLTAVIFYLAYFLKFY